MPSVIAIRTLLNFLFSMRLRIAAVSRMQGVAPKCLKVVDTGGYNGSVRFFGIDFQRHADVSCHARIPSSPRIRVLIHHTELTFLPKN